MKELKIGDKVLLTFEGRKIYGIIRARYRYCNLVEFYTSQECEPPRIEMRVDEDLKKV